MKTPLKNAAFCLFALALPSAHADEKAIRDTFSKYMPDVVIHSVKPTEIKGVFELNTNSSVIYVSEDGKYALQGRLIDVATSTDLTEQKMAATRLDDLKQLGTDKMIVFTPKIKKYTVSVFTDIDCGYCRKLHSELDQYLAEGITIQYLLYPRAGVGSESYRKAVSVWCADDRNAALTLAKKDTKIPEKSCTNPIDEHLKLGEKFGAQGTPMIVLEQGHIYPGYLPAKELVQALEKEKASK